MRRPQDAYSHSFTQDKRKPQKSSTHKRPSMLQSAIGTRSGRKKKCGNYASGFSPRFRRIRKNLSIKAVRSGAGSARFPAGAKNPSSVKSAKAARNPKRASQSPQPDFAERKNMYREKSETTLPKLTFYRKKKSPHCSKSASRARQRHRSRPQARHREAWPKARPPKFPQAQIPI